MGTWQGRDGDQPLAGLASLIGRAAAAQIGDAAVG